MIYPRRFFVVKGRGLSRTSDLLAFNNALKSAGIHQLNLVPVSSILPPDAEEEDYHPLPPGAIAFVVMSEKRAKGPAKISAGVSWARGRPHGYVLEFHDGNSSQETLKRLESMWQEIVEGERLDLEEPRYVVEELEVPEGFYGSVVAALVFSKIDYYP
jgi:arginine decarboxylase